MRYIYDIETFPNCFIFRAMDVETRTWMRFEISDRANDLDGLRQWILAVNRIHGEMVGFNNIGFDYPVLHFIITCGISNPKAIYDRAMAIINAEDHEKFRHLIKPSEWLAPQIDLFKIHHFDNKARRTGLKALEFNMRMSNIADLPFPVGNVLLYTQMDTLGTYCENDVLATLEFYNKSLEKIEFREQLSKTHQISFMNFSDVKIGKQIFQMALEKAGVQCYVYDRDFGRRPLQTMREKIDLYECVPDFIEFEEPAFNNVLGQIMAKTITHTKGAFDDLSANINGLEFKFGTGGLHASVENSRFHSDKDYVVYDIDVTSLYPSIAIEHGFYPEHLTPKFVEVYRELREQRVGYKKGTPENAMLKLALNGVYGDSNNPFGIFFDPLFTMKITIAGQLMIAMLAEQLMRVTGLTVIQVNTDGITMHMPRSSQFLVDMVCWGWEKTTRLKLESAEYSGIAIADVNSYIAQKMDGSVKRVGRYEYDVDWHQDASALVVAKVAEQVIIHGKPIRETVETWPEPMDFMLRVKVNRDSRLIAVSADGLEFSLENTQRYYMSKTGVEMVKIMPPLAKKPNVWRRIAVQKGYKVIPCNRMSNVDMGKFPIDYDWYINEVEKLVMGVM